MYVGASTSRAVGRVTTRLAPIGVRFENLKANVELHNRHLRIKRKMLGSAPRPTHTTLPSEAQVSSHSAYAKAELALRLRGEVVSALEWPTQ